MRNSNSVHYFASFGPADGPLRYREAMPSIGVFARSRRQSSRGCVFPVGIAHPAAWTEYHGIIAATFRLVIGTDELKGRWVCDRRLFVVSELTAER